MFDNEESGIHRWKQVESSLDKFIPGEHECVYCIHMRNIRNDTITNHKETSCGTDRTVSELHRIVV